MKKIFTLIISACCSLAIAQPVFQYANYPSVTAGITATVYVGPVPASAGPSGAGVTWNFSSLTFTPAGTAAIVSPTATPYSSSFPTADWSAAISTTIAGSQYSYINVQPTYVDQLGDAITATGGQTYTPNPKRQLIFPFNYGNSYSDTYQCISCSPGSFTVTYDSYGTLLINGKTYYNVARVASQFGYPYYNYYNTNPIVSIFSFDTSPSSTGPSVYVDVAGVGTGIKENYVVSHMNIYPNPAKDLVNVQNNNFVQVDVEMTDLMGKSVMEKRHLNQGENAKIDVQGLPAGIYFLKYTDEFLNSSYTKLIVE